MNSPKDMTVYNMHQEMSAWAQANKIKFVHCRALNYSRRHLKNYEYEAKGGCTVAWQREGQNIIKVSVALVNPKDCYNKADGRMFSTMKFKAGHWIQLHVPKNMAVSKFIKSTFIKG